MVLPIRSMIDRVTYRRSFISTDVDRREVGL